MAKKKVSKSNISAKFNKRKSERIDLDTGGGGNWPAGIEAGVAKIESMKLDKHGPDTRNPGKYYFLMRGVAVAPEVHEGVPVLGVSDNLIMEPLYNTPGRKRESEEDHIDYLISVLQDLGVETDELTWEELESGELFQAIVEEEPHARFRTWKGEPTEEYPNPRTNIQYKGSCEPVDVEEDDVTESEDDGEEEEPRPTKKKASKKKEPEPEEEESDDENVITLGVTADEEGDESDAAAELTELAQAAGLDPAEFDTWSELAEALTGQEDSEDENEDEEDEDEGEEEEEALVPEKGDVVSYKPPRKRKPVDCEVTLVNATKKTCTVKNLDDGKLYKGVNWSELSEAE